LDVVGPANSFISQNILIDSRYPASTVGPPPV
jgi:hypothetical protein